MHNAKVTISIYNTLTLTIYNNSTIIEQGNDPKIN